MLTSSLLSDYKSHGSNPMKSTMRSSSFLTSLIYEMMSTNISNGMISSMLNNSAYRSTYIHGQDCPRILLSLGSCTLSGSASLFPLGSVSPIYVIAIYLPSCRLALFSILLNKYGCQQCARLRQLWIIGFDHP